MNKEDYLLLKVIYKIIESEANNLNNAVLTMLDVYELNNLIPIEILNNINKATKLLFDSAKLIKRRMKNDYS